MRYSKPRFAQRFTKKRLCDDYYEPEIFFGFGTAYDLRDAPDTNPRLWFAKSVARGAAMAMSVSAELDEDRAEFSIGFHTPPVLETVIEEPPKPKSRKRKP